MRENEVRPDLPEPLGVGLRPACKALSAPASTGGSCGVGLAPFLFHLLCIEAELSHDPSEFQFLWFKKKMSLPLIDYARH